MPRVTVTPDVESNRSDKHQPPAPANLLAKLVSLAHWFANEGSRAPHERGPQRRLRITWSVASGMEVDKGRWRKSEGQIGSMKVRCKSVWLLHLAAALRPFGTGNLITEQCVQERHASAATTAGRDHWSAAPRSGHSPHGGNPLFDSRQGSLTLSGSVTAALVSVTSVIPVPMSGGSPACEPLPEPVVVTCLGGPFQANVP